MRQGRRIASTFVAALAAVSALAIFNGGPAAAGGSSQTCHGIPATNVGTNSADHIRTGSGRDVVVGHDGNDVISTGSGKDIVCGNGGTDTLLGNGGADRLYGGAGTDVIHGQSGADRLFGGNGRDALFGGKRNDLLFGQSGGDWLDGDRQRDHCTGGEPRRDLSPHHTGDFATKECEVVQSAYQPQR
jgi:Ca2+-binding RTX toxin-like protein